MGSDATGASKVHMFLQQQWNTANAQPTTASQSIGELVGVLLKNPYCPAILQQWQAAQTTRTIYANDEQSAEFTASMDEALRPACAQSIVSGTGVEPVFSSKELDATLVWVNYDSKAGNTSVTITLTGGSVFANDTVYSLGFEGFRGDKFITGVVDATGAGTATLTFDINVGGFLSWYPSSEKGLGGASTAWPSPTFTVAVVEPAGFVWRPVSFVDAAGDQVALYYTATRTNASSIISTNAANMFNAEGMAAGITIPHGQRFDSLFYSHDGTPVASPFSIVSTQSKCRVKSAATGVSEFCYFNSVKDLTGGLDDDTAQNDAVAWDGMPPVPLDRVTEGSIIVLKTGVANNVARDGTWQIWQHIEGPTDNMAVPTGPPQLTPDEFNRACFLQTQIQSFAGNPSHVATIMQRVRSIGQKAGKVMTIGGPAIAAAGLPVMAANPAVGAAISAGGMATGALGAMLQTLLE